MTTLFEMDRLQPSDLAGISIDDLGKLYLHLVQQAKQERADHGERSDRLDTLYRSMALIGSTLRELAGGYENQEY